jgi:hypothetical protein
MAVDMTVMPDQTRKKDYDCQCNEATVSEGGVPPEVPVCMTLESIIDLTGELEHLNELVMLHLEKAGGFASQASYFATVQPILDMLEIEIRVRCRSGMTQQQVKLIVQDWIDHEIAGLR